MPEPKDPTQPGVSSETETEEPQEIDHREAAIEEIANRRREELRAEGFDIPTDEPTEEPAAEPAPTVEAERAPEPEPEQEMVKVVVDGEEREVPLSDILDAGRKTYQKESAADKRLREATELLKRAQSQDRAQAPPTGVREQPDQDDDLGVSDEEIAQIVSDIQYGSSEAATEATKRLLKMSRGQGAAPAASVTPDDVERIVKYNEIRTRFTSEFKDIEKDARLYNMATVRANELLQAGEPDDWSTYEKAGKEIRSWFFGKDSASPNNRDGNVRSLQDKREKKTEIEDVSGTGASESSSDASAPVLPTAASRSKLIQEEIEAKRRALNS